MKELVVVARVFSGIEIALKTGHWEHSEALLTIILLGSLI